VCDAYFGNIFHIQDGVRATGNDHPSFNVPPCVRGDLNCGGQVCDAKAKPWPPCMGRDEMGFLLRATHLLCGVRRYEGCPGGGSLPEPRPSPPAIAGSRFTEFITCGEACLPTFPAE
jgi:hypothetical protein